MLGTRVDIAFDPERTPASRVVLIGPMGAGKTTLARRWAASGGTQLWFDSDDATLERLGMPTVSAAFEQLGEPAFREAERDVIIERSGTLQRGVEVWSLGGGAVDNDEVRDVIAGSVVVWLDAPRDVLWNRIAGSDRPLARDRESFEHVLVKRTPTYEALAGIRINTDCDLDDLGLGRLLAQHLPPSWFGSGLVIGCGLTDRFEDLGALDGGVVAVVADQAVDSVADRITDALARRGVRVASDMRLAMGEWNKQLSAAEHIIKTWADAGVHRKCLVIAIGGGTTLDVVGFAASLYQRGIEWVAVPTTLTSQVDAGIGGKTGVNLGVVKNVIGTVHLPRATLVDPTLARSLDEQYISDGFVEAAKTAVLAGEWLMRRAEAVAAGERGARDHAWTQLIEGSAAYKDAVVAEDPFDTDGIRAQLNLGHTIGHAIEAASRGSVTHGAAVAVGTYAALHISRFVLDAPADIADRWHALCADMGIGVQSSLEWDAIEPFLKLDKKRDEQGVGWVLVEDIGRPVTGAHVPLEAVAGVWKHRVHVAAEADPSVGSQSGREAGREPRVLVLFGVNLGELGRREVEQYGSDTLPQLIAQIEAWASGHQLRVDCRQTDSLERYISALHEARETHDAVIVNPGAWTHYERSLHDALSALPIPCVEVHLSDVNDREAWRSRSVISDAVDHTIVGEQAAGFDAALAWISDAIGTINQ